MTAQLKEIRQEAFALSGYDKKAPVTQGMQKVVLATADLMYADLVEELLPGLRDKRLIRKFRPSLAVAA